MHTTLYRKWRPTDFSSVVGQEHITEVLKYEVQHGKTTHAYLFCGSRGTGKTTCAKILAKAVNCLSPENGNPCGKCEACLSVEQGNATDIIEMDAASNNGVEYIRDIREEVIYTPAFLKKKVYIIDEVHMLSQSAFNALLKTLEEPPEHVIFILATTELHKLPATITSRCQRFDFRRISTDDIAGRLEHIALKENISLTHEAAKLIGRLSQGGMRDAISLLELCSGTGKTVDIALVNECAGVSGRSDVERLVKAVSKKDHSLIFSEIAGFSSSAVDITVFWQELISYYRDMLIVKVTKEPSALLDLTSDELSTLKSNASVFTREKLLYHINLLENAYLTMQRNDSLRRITAEMTLVKMTDDKLSDTTEALLSRIASLEERIASGNAVLSVPTAHSSEIIETKDDNEPAPIVETPTETVVPSDDERRIDSWIEIVKNVERRDEGLASTLKFANASFVGRKLVITVDNEFSKMLIQSSGSAEIIASAVNMTDDFSGVLPSDITVVVSKSSASTSDFLSDF